MLYILEPHLAAASALGLTAGVEEVRERSSYWRYWYSPRASSAYENGNM